MIALALVACAPQSGTPSTSGSVESVEPSASQSAPTDSATVAPITRADWKWQGVAEGPNAKIVSVREIDGRLYALGADPQPAIWSSDDSVAWTRATVPVPPAHLAFTVTDLVAVHGRLVAIATGGASGGSGPFATAVYVSTDGAAWTEVIDTPGRETAALHSLAIVGSRIVAVGQGAWASNDDGLSWTSLIAATDLRGFMASVVEADGLLVGVGQAGGGDVIDPPALGWISDDAGAIWARQEFTDGAYAQAVAVLESGRIVIAGQASAPQDDAWLIWYSDDAGTNWNKAQGPRAWAWALTPDGLVASGRDATGPAKVYLSADGLAWAELSGDETLGEAYPSDLSWGPRFGLVMSVGEGSIAQAPNPQR